MKFLVTNDDGIYAPGLVALVDALRELGEVVVVAPEHALSGCGHRATTDRPLELRRVASGWHVLDGLPVDCTRIGLAHVAADADWVVAGVNEGGNLGADVYLSGTVAAAREACLLGRPAMAISQYHRRGPIDWLQASRHARRVVQMILARPAVLGRFWNVNIPHGEAGNKHPDCVDCPLDPHPLPIRYESTAGKLHYRVDYHARRREPRHDVDVCFAGSISITQLGLV